MTLPILIKVINYSNNTITIMKAIRDLSKLPKYLQVTKWQVEQSYNKYLPKPYREGEIVKVQPMEAQKPNHMYDHMTLRIPPTTDESFNNSYVRIIRKDSDGRFTHPCALEWSALDYLKKVNL